MAVPLCMGMQKDDDCAVGTVYPCGGCVAVYVARVSVGVGRSVTMWRLAPVAVQVQLVGPP